MKKMLKIVYVGAAMLLLLPLVAGAQVYMNDTFTDGGRTNGADALDAAWYTTSGGTLSVANNPTIGSGNAMTFNPQTVDVNNKSPKYQQRIVGQFGSTASLTNAGDWIKLSFDVLVDTNNPISTANIRTFRFGLFDSQGTTFSADAVDVNSSSFAGNDKGYMAAISVSPSVRGDLLAETASDVTFCGGSPLTILSNTSLAGISEITKYSMSLIITRLTSAADSNVSVEYTLDGVSTLLNSSYGTSTSRFFSFDEVGIAGGVATTPFSYLDYTVDNVKVETIPEPATMSILAMGTLLLTRFQRRRK
jgi:hypothetical protein